MTGDMTDDPDRGRAELAARFAAIDDNAADGEFQAACLATLAVAPEVRADRLQAALDEYVAACDEPEVPWAFLRRLGFQGLRAAGAMVAGTRMDRVLARRAGIPISLGVVLIQVARAQGLDAWGVNYPGHFLVRVNERLVDPFEMETVSEADCLARLPAAHRQDAFVRAPARMMALRMLNNVKYEFAATACFDRAVEMLDYQLAISPGEASLLLERGDFWLRLGALQAARADFERCRDGAGPDSELGRAADAQLARIAGRRDTLH